MMENNTRTKFQDYIDEKKELYDLLLEYIEDQEEEGNFLNLIKFVDDSEILKDNEELILFLRLISKISKYHYRTPCFIGKIERILLHYQNQIKQTLSNFDISQIFKNSKRILLFLIEKEIIKADKEIVNQIILKIDKNFTKYSHFFYPEVEAVMNEQNPSIVESIKNELLSIDPNIFTNYEEKRQLGENESYICNLIRNDSVEDFISHVNRTNMNLFSIIEPSIFETNSYLIKNKPTLIEYAAFYGSIQIFQYLKMNCVSLKPILWFYVIHGNNPEMIHLLEENHVSTIFYGSYSKCLEAAIQFHNKSVIEYVLNNVIKEVDLFQEESNSYEDNMFSYCFHYINFAYFPTINYNNQYILFYLCQYNYYNLVVLYQQTRELNLNETVSVMNVILYFMNFNNILAF